jgi:hypothetical protein
VDPQESFSFLSGCVALAVEFQSFKLDETLPPTICNGVGYNLIFPLISTVNFFYVINKLIILVLGLH